MPRAHPREVARRLRAGHELRLVCAYEADASFARFPLEGAVPWSALAAELDALDSDVEIVLYCRCPEDRTAARAAAELARRGFTGVKVLDGGHAAAAKVGLAP